MFHCKGSFVCIIQGWRNSLSISVMNVYIIKLWMVWMLMVMVVVVGGLCRLVVVMDIGITMSLNMDMLMGNTMSPYLSRVITISLALDRVTTIPLNLHRCIAPTDSLVAGGVMSPSGEGVMVLTRMPWPAIHIPVAKTVKMVRRVSRVVKVRGGIARRITVFTVK